MWDSFTWQLAKQCENILVNFFNYLGYISIFYVVVYFSGYKSTTWVVNFVFKFQWYFVRNYISFTQFKPVCWVKIVSNILKLNFTTISNE